MDIGKCSSLDNECCYINMSKYQHLLALKTPRIKILKYLYVQLS